VTLQVLTIPGDDVFLFICRDHRARAAKDLALGQLRALEGEDPYPAQLRSAIVQRVVQRKKKAMADVDDRRTKYEDAVTRFALFDTVVQDAIRAQAAAFHGLTLSEESPWYRQRFVVLVGQAHALLGDDRDKR
jgi:hypothetical protein